MTSDFHIAVHALICLHRKGRSLSSEELSKNVCTNPARVRRVMAKLGKGRLLETKEGIHGGYQLPTGADAVTLCQIAKALDVKFVDTNWRNKDIDRDCMVASGIMQTMQSIYEQLNDLCLQRLENITLADIDRMLPTLSKNNVF